MLLARDIKLDILLSHSTYDHIHWRTRDPVRSPLDKPVRAGLVVGSVTTSEYPVLYVFLAIFLRSVLVSHRPIN